MSRLDFKGPDGTVGRNRRPAHALFVPKRCPIVFAGHQCTLEFAHDGLHQSFHGHNPHRYIRRDDR